MTFPILATYPLSYTVITENGNTAVIAWEDDTVTIENAWQMLVFGNTVRWGRTLK